MIQSNTQDFSTSDFISRVIGVPWANRACSFESRLLGLLCVLYYRHVLGIELHQTPDYEAGEDFFTCHEGVVFWRKVDKPVDGGIFVELPRRATGACWSGTEPGAALRGENGSVRMDSLLVIQRAFTKVEYFSYGAG